MKVKANQAIFVDDTLENVTAANQIGMHGIQFMSHDQIIQDVNKLIHKLEQS